MQAAAAAPLGTRANPISRPLFNAQVLYRVVNLDPSGRVTGVKTPQAGEPPFFARKVAPTLVLFPPAGELTAELEPGMRGAEGAADGVKTLLRTKSNHTFEEAFMSIYGKALLLNFCSPSMEVYPKDSKDCQAIYGPELRAANAVPLDALVSDVNLHAYLTQQLRRTGKEPIEVIDLDEARIRHMRKVMIWYKEQLKRDEPWRMAWNKNDALVVAYKLTRENLADLLKLLGSDLSPDARLHRGESYDPKYEFGVGDYVVIDLEPWVFSTSSAALKYDKNREVLVRTVNGDAFEHTYGKA